MEESKIGIPGVKTDERRIFHQVSDSDVTMYQIEDEMVSSEGEGEDRVMPEKEGCRRRFNVQLG